MNFPTNHQVGLTMKGAALPLSLSPPSSPQVKSKIKDRMSTYHTTGLATSARPSEKDHTKRLFETAIMENTTDKKRYHKTLP